jgi:hypothetical protein
MSETETQNKTRIVRKKQVLERTNVQLSYLDERLILRNPDEPDVPGIVRNDGSPIKRLKSIPLGARAVGFLESDVDALIEALQDSKRVKVWPRPAKATTPPRQNTQPKRQIARARSRSR